MRGVRFAEFGGVDVLTYGELPDLDVYADQVLVRVHAVGANPLDAYIRAGYMQQAFHHHLPIIPGHDVAGEVVAVGLMVNGYDVGERVFALALKDYIEVGTYAEFATIPDRMVARIPDGLTFVQAAALPMSGLAAWQSLNAVDVGPPDVVVVNAAAGGVGHLAVQLARERGASRVIGLASEGNHDFIRSLGAEPVTHGPGVAERVAAVVGGDGKVDAVLDPLGGECLQESFACARDPRRVACLTDPTVLEHGGKFLGARPDGSQLARLAALVESGRLRVEIQQTLPLTEARQAHRLLETRHVRGKIVLTTQPSE
jgi:NADPH:quinone reductase-like Zn-dependent oxidoreductase